MTVIPVLSGVAAARWVAELASRGDGPDVRAAVARIIGAVRRRGDAALRELTERFDRVEPDRLAVPAAERRAALEHIAPERRAALEAARQRLERFHGAQVRSGARVEVAPGVTVWQEFRPLERVGIYVPGGRAGYPSTALMCGVPARLAGCRTIVACVPPGPDGRPPEAVLAVAELLDFDAVYCVGGAQAIAALAYGTETVLRVDKIVGPGNAWVKAAKLLVYGAVDIDVPAGPSELVVLADDTADPRWVAADLVSQAEHATDALAAAVTWDPQLARTIAVEVERALQTLPTREVARAALKRSAVCVAPDLDVAVDWVNRLAPEHLMVVTRDDDAVASRIDHAGSVFLGPHSPVAAGDYASGANHVLPTGRCARAWGALSVDDFGRWRQVQRLTREALAELAPTVATLARWEGFEAHARAVEARLTRGAP